MMALIMWLYHYCGSNAASEIVVFWRSFLNGIKKLVVRVGGSFVDAGKCDLWVSEALLYAKYVITSLMVFNEPPTAAADSLTWDDLSDIFMEKNVSRRATESSIMSPDLTEH